MVSVHLDMLWTDWLVYGLLVIAITSFIWMRKQPHLRRPWQQVLQSKLAMCTLVILLFYLAIGLLDSIHLKIIHQNKQQQVSAIKNDSLLDLMLGSLKSEQEKSYSAPFAIRAFTPTLVSLPSGKEVRSYVRLKYGGVQLKSIHQRTTDIIWRVVVGFVIGLFSFFVLSVLLIAFLAWRRDCAWLQQYHDIVQGKTTVAWRETMITFAIIWILVCIVSKLAFAYHILGTDKVGRDIFYQTLKSVRTGLLIGTLTTIFMLPFALFFGTLAGYFRGFVDDIIQYLYITLSSIPGVLLISGTILVMQVYIAGHPHLFPSLAERADARLLALTFILGITSWASLCRFLRGETLKLRNLEYVQAARALGVKQRKIIIRHIIPNVMHIVLITLVLDFSGLVLAEAVLSYVGIGVDPTTMSWGNMINASRLELAREPVVWWPLLAALVSMFVLVLCANLFADKVRDAFDPRSQSR